MLLVERDERGSPQLKKGTRRSWARPPPRKQVASARANKQQVRLEELCFQSGGLQRRAVPEEARGMGKGGEGGGGGKGCRPGRRGSCKPLRRRRRTRTLSAAPYTHPQCRVLVLSGW